MSEFSKKIQDFLTDRIDALLTGNAELKADVGHAISRLDEARQELANQRDQITDIKSRLAAVEAGRQALIDSCATAADNAGTQFMTRHFSDILSRISVLELQAKKSETPSGIIKRPEKKKSS